MGYYALVFELCLERMIYIYIYIFVCVCVCVCVRAHARAHAWAIEKFKDDKKTKVISLF